MSDAQSSGGYVKLISPQDYRVYSVPSGQRAAYEKAGYVAPQAEINPEEIQQHFSGWSGAGKSFLLGAVDGVPFAKTLISHLSTQEQAKTLQESIDAAHRDYPITSGIGSLAGSIGGGLAEVAGAGALISSGAGALGLGALGAGGALEAGALGAEATGALGGAAGLGEGAAAAGAEALGTQGATAAARQFALKDIATIAGKGAAYNAGFGQIARIDDHALRHAADPEGQEKIVYDLNGTLLDAALGAALPVGVHGLGKALGFAGKKLGSKGMELMQSALTKADAMDAAERQGRLGDVRAKLETVITAGRKNPAAYIKNRVQIAGNDIEDLKALVKGSRLDGTDMQALRDRLRSVLGQKNRIHSRIADIYDGDARYDITDLQKLNEKIYKEIVFAEGDLRPEANKRYLDAADAVKAGMLKLAAKGDPSQGEAQAQKFATALKEYSDWQLAAAVIKRGQGPKGVKEIARDIATGGITGGVAGFLFGSFGGAAASAAGGAGYKAVTALDASHYGKAATMLGAAFNTADRGLSHAVEAGLYGTPALLHKMNSAEPYQDLASKVSAARQDPQQTFVNLRSALTKANVPDHIADDVAMAQHTQIQWLASKLPGRQIAPDVASSGQGDPMQQRRFVGQVKSVQDPTYALAHPTQTNLEVLKQFYPNVLHNAQQAILSQVQRNPTLPAASRQWASRVLGRPMGNLSSPTFSVMLQTARQAAAQVAQQGAPPPKSSGGKASGPNLQTRFDELQGDA